MAHVATITIDPTKVAISLTDFPVFVDLSDMGASFWATVADGGGDIRVFKDDDSTELPREVVTCTTADDKGELHIKFTGTLSGAAETDIHIYADGSSSEPAADSTYGSEAVWSDYNAVWHMNATSGDETDSTANGLDLTDNNTVTSAAGKLGGYANGAREFTRSNNESLSHADSALLSLGANDMTYQLWIKFATVNQTLYYITQKGWYDPTASNREIGLNYYTGGGTDASRMEVWDGGFQGANAVSDLGTTDWHMWVSKRDSNDIKTIVDGSITGTDTVGTCIDGTDPFVIGIGYHSSGPASSSDNPMDGLIDEFRVRQEALIDDWITTEYNNQNDPGTFYAVTDIEPTPSGPATLKTFNTIETASVKTIDVTDLGDVKTINTAA